MERKRKLCSTRGITLIELLFALVVLMSPFYLLLYTRKAYLSLGKGHLIPWAHHGQWSLIFVAVLALSLLGLKAYEWQEKRNPTEASSFGTSFGDNLAGILFFVLFGSLMLLVFSLLTLLGDVFASIAFAYFRYL
jgi:hypothetical protein